jgi:hypothetical protein
MKAETGHSSPQPSGSPESAIISPVLGFRPERAFLLRFEDSKAAYINFLSCRRADAWVTSSTQEDCATKNENYPHLFESTHPLSS